MTSDPTLQKAQRLLKEERSEEAREILLLEGFIKISRPEIQNAFMSLMPPTPTLQKMLDGPYQRLNDKSATGRMRGLTQIGREIAREVPLDGVRWMRDPRASMPIIERLADADKKVAARALLVLMRLIWRFFPDQRAEAALIAKLADGDQEQRVWAISALANLRREAVLDKLAPLLTDGTEQDRLAVASSLYGLFSEDWVSLHQMPLELSASGRKRWTQLLEVATQDESEAVRRSALTAREWLERKSPRPGE